MSTPRSNSGGKRWPLVLAIPFGVVALCGGASAADAVSSRPLKAALILRLVDFVVWPTDGQAATFPVCIVADEPLAEAVRQSALILKASRAKVEVRRHTTLRTATGCRLLYIGEYDEHLLRSFLAAHRREPILTVGETDEFLDAGGVLRIRVENGRVNIDLRLAAAAAAKLQISSRLARLANIVDQEAGGGPK
ncbi:MAG: YfiR family protein [Bryobacterales bacterium]|nr:YfiR family protein [Bryobacterales bacterium]